MFNRHSELIQFYNEHVRLSREQRQALATYRDANLDRLRTGLSKTDHHISFEYIDQGSYPTFTTVQHPLQDYDIDTAIVFPKGSLPSTALKTRQLIEEAVQAAGGNFAKPPEARTNAVTIWYQEGHHVDLSVYRVSEDTWGRPICEHAGADWETRDPYDVTTWLNQTIESCSPSKELGATVDNNQMRRMIQLVKAFSRSRENWDLPGGYVISKLVHECYRPDWHRDDVALYDTLTAIEVRLQLSHHVFSPIDGKELTCKPGYLGQVKRFGEKLTYILPKLAKLFEHDCTEVEANEAWFQVFQNGYWSSKESIDELGKRLGNTALKGKLYVSANTHTIVTNPSPHDMQVRGHNFYGEEC